MPSLNTKLASAPNTQANYVLKATSSTTIGNSIIQDNGSTATIAGDLRLNNGTADGAQLILASSGFSDWNIDNFSGRFRAYYGSTEYFTILANGNVGIGTSSIANGTAFGGGGQVNRLKVASGNYTCLEVNGSTSGGSLQFTYGTDLPNQVGALIAYNYASGGDLGMYISNVTNGIISFATNNTERMRITSGGDVQVQGTNSNAKIILFRNYSNSQPGISVYNTSNTEVMYFNGNTGGLGIVQSGNTFTSGFITQNTSGNTWGLVAGGDNNFYIGFNASSRGYFSSASGNYVALSDVNKKKDFEQSTIGLNAILGLKPTLFRMKEDDESVNKQLGFIAQEVKDLIPQAYTESTNGEDTFIGLTQMPIIAALVKAIQEQNEIITKQGQAIEELKALINK